MRPWILLTAAVALGGCGGELGGSPGGDAASNGDPDAGTNGDANGALDDTDHGPGGDANGGQPADPGGSGDPAPVVTQITVAMAGDIVESGRTQYAKANAATISNHIPAVSAVVLAGDNARYFSGGGGLLSFYNTYYEPLSQANWGQFDPIAFPALGNHEYNETNALGYFDYYASRMLEIAALPTYHGYVNTVGKGYYSFDLNGWHFVSINSNCSDVSDGCAAGSDQEVWVKSDLVAHATMPIIAVWHAPRFACGGTHGDATDMQAMWADLVDAGVDFLFAGHNHYYQRWKPLNKINPNATVDTQRGVTEIVAGSYGVSPHTVCSPVDSRIVTQIGGEGGMGAFFLTLGSDGTFSFQYILESDGSVFDASAGRSHHAP